MCAVGRGVYNGKFNYRRRVDVYIKRGVVVVVLERARKSILFLECIFHRSFINFSDQLTARSDVFRPVETKTGEER